MSAMSDDTPLIQCSNPDCKIAETGQCVEGLDSAVCGNYGKPLRLLAESVDVASANPEVVSLPHADRLNPTEARNLLRKDRARVIAIVGPHDSGKTSLIASVYDQLQEGPIRPFAFRGSRSLHAFEQACHDARAASERGVPHSERTKRGEVRFYHLDLLDQRANEPITLMLGDRAGEEYREAGDEIDLAHEFIEVARADVVTLLVDGKRLADDGQRHNTRDELLVILQALKDADVVAAGTRLAIVLTKIDAVRVSPNSNRVDADLAADVAKLQTHFADCFADFATFRIAASPTEHGVVRGIGVADVLAYWLSDVPALCVTVAPHERHPRVIGRLVEVDL